MTTVTSPFQERKWELAGEKLYFLPSGLYSRLSDRRSIYIIGPRGTGKTTLLMSFSYKERLNNFSLQKALRDNPFSDRAIGIYLKTPQYDWSIIESWSANASATIAASICSFYFDVIWVQASCTGLIELWSSGTINLETRSERNAVNEIISFLPIIRQYSETNKIQTLFELSSALSGLRLSIERHARFGVPIADLGERLPVLSCGEFGLRFAAAIKSHFPEFSGPKAWHLRILVDEAENISSLQQLIFNTTIRLTIWPVLFTISYVAPPSNTITTLKDKLTTASPELEVIYLNEGIAPDFKNLVLDICSGRLSAAKGRSVRINLETMLGQSYLNKVLLLVLKRSTSEAAKELIEYARSNAIVAAYSQREFRNPVEPIYEAYLTRKLQLSLPSQAQEKYKRRAQASREIRKKNVAAYLSIFSELGSDPIYFGEEMFLQLTDNCIRDFLLQMHHLHSHCIEKGINPNKFGEKEIAWEHQNQALVRAATDKVTSLSSEPNIRSALPIKHLVMGLGVITKRLQSTSSNLSHLRSSERGRFILKRLPGTDAAYEEALKLIREADEAGHLKILKRHSDHIEFRVHCSVAPLYHFSYRGAMYDTPISPDDLLILANPERSFDLETNIDRVHARCASLALDEPGQQRIFP